ncbi:MAG: DUF1934 domain-containing protein [Ruminococcaceae bacterium]|nr:DUF1934 domain-containing protein [Oscillospiraceae bacterium]
MDVLIHISGTQTLAGEKPDTIELTTTGTLQQTIQGWQLCYQETEATGLPGTTTTVHISPCRIVLERTGPNASILVLEKHKRHHCNYNTPYGMMDLGTFATAIDYHLGDTGGTLDFAYTLGFNGGINSSHAVHIEVEDKQSCRLS